jgi:hypothetical protein
MQIRFLSDGNEYRSYGGGSFSKKKDSGGIFWWTILITLADGLRHFLLVLQHHGVRAP